MLYTALTKRAMTFAQNLHRDHLDAFGTPLMVHLCHLAESMNDEDTVIVAFLHESIERGATVEELRSFGFSEKDVEAVNLLTDRGERQYIRYIRRIRDNQIAATVKAADLRHDIDITRMNAITDEDAKRLQLYERALKVLARK